MSLEDLDALLNTPIGKKVKKKKKKGRKSRASGVVKGQSDRIMSQIEEAQRRIDNWRLSTDPTTTLIIVQRTYCTGCGQSNDATISPPMTGYQDRLGRTHYVPTHIPSRTLPIKISRTEVRVPICHECYASAPHEERTFTANSIGQINTNERQLSLRERASSPPTKAPKATKALVPIAHTPQAIMWIFWALIPISEEYTQ